MGVTGALVFGTGKLQTSVPPSIDTVPGASPERSSSITAAWLSGSWEAVIDFSAPRYAVTSSVRASASGRVVARSSRRSRPVCDGVREYAGMLPSSTTTRSQPPPGHPAPLADARSKRMSRTLATEACAGAAAAARAAAGTGTAGPEAASKRRSVVPSGTIR